MWKKKKDRKQVPGSGWMRIALALFILWLAFSGYKNEQKAAEGDPTAVTYKRYEVIDRLTEMDHWKKIANPAFRREIEFEDIKTGMGDFAACGQRVTLKVTAIAPEGKEPDATLTPKEPIVFTIGRMEALGAFDRGVRGMRKGGERRLWAGVELVYPEIPDGEGEPVMFDLELLELEPNLSEGSTNFYYEKTDTGYGLPLSCGDEISIIYKIFDKDLQLIHSSEGESELVFRLGYGEYGHGFDRGLVGMRPGEVRLLRIPPAYQPQKSDIPFPKDEIAIVEVMRLPYKNEHADTIETEGTDNGTDRQPVERDQTIPDDGGDSEGSGAESIRP